MKDTIINVSNLSYSYGDTKVLESVNFEIQRKDFVAISGANGSGKSTLMKLLLGLLPCKEGTVSLFGEDVSTLLNFSNIGYVPQGGLLQVSRFPATVLETILLRIPKANFFNFSNKSRMEEAMKTLRHVGMQDYAHRLISSLSGGQLQRVLIARELMMNPEIIFLDEPTSGLDKASIETLYLLLDHINEVHDITIVMITHHLDQTVSKINRHLVVDDHRVEEVRLDV